MNAELRMRNSSSPVVASTDSLSLTTTAPLPLSYRAAILPVVLSVPSGGNGRASSIACSPCTSIAGLNGPILSSGTAPRAASTTAIVGSTCWFFSVENVRSSRPAPTPSAYKRQSLLLQLRSTGPPLAPTAPGSRVMRAILPQHGRERICPKIWSGTLRLERVVASGPRRDARFELLSFSGRHRRAFASGLQVAADLGDRAAADDHRIRDARRVADQLFGRRGAILKQHAGRHHLHPDHADVAPARFGDDRAYER